MLEINNLNKSFKHKKVLNDVNVRFQNGVCGLLGPNGSGKTTLFRCICGVLGSDSKQQFGSFNGKSFKEINIGYLPQNFRVLRELTVLEAMLFFANLKGFEKSVATDMCKAYIETVNLTEKLNERVKTLSGGMMRRLEIAQTLICNPDIILFDEPTAGLDPEERMRFKNIVKEIKQDKLIIISTHIIEDIEALFDTVAVMQSGRIIFDGSCALLRTKAEGAVFTALANDATKGVEINKIYEQDGDRFVRFISREENLGQSVKPELEDGYICVLKNI